MKKSYFVLVFLILILITLSLHRHPRIKNIDSSGKTIVCFGNSLTYGYGAEKGFDYPSWLQKMTNFPVINAGRNGDTTFDALKRLKSDVLEKDPFLVIVEFGGNDLLKGISQKQTIRNIEEIIKEIQHAGVMVVLVEPGMGVFKTKYLKSYKRVARKYHALFIPNILKGILTDPRLKYDYIHPNSQGYKIMTERIFKEIELVLKYKIKRR